MKSGSGSKPTHPLGVFRAANSIEQRETPVSNTNYDLPDDDDLDDSESTGPKDLRDALKRAKRQIAELTKTNQELSGKSRKSDLASVLEEAGLKPKLAGLYPADAEVDLEKVKAWAAGYADVFGIEVAEDTAPAVDDATTQAAGAISRASANAPAAPVTAGFDALAAQMGEKTWEQLQKEGLAGAKAYGINGG